LAFAKYGTRGVYQLCFVLFVDRFPFRNAANVYQISVRSMMYDKWSGRLHPCSMLGEVAQLFSRWHYADLRG
jgi:hypothetical protein